MCKWQPYAKQSFVAPQIMATGRVQSTTSKSSNVSNEKSDFMENARKEARRQGFSFFADDLATASRSAWKMLQIMDHVHGPAIIDHIVSN